MNIWKIGLSLTILVSLFTGCASDKENLTLQNKTAKQALLIQKQQVEIHTLKERLTTRTRSTGTYGQTATVPVVKKNIKLKKVEDTNFSSNYMYPQTKVTPRPKPAKEPIVQEQAAKESVVKKPTTKELVKEPAKESVKESVKESAKESVTKPIIKPVTKLAQAKQAKPKSNISKSASATIGKTECISMIGQEKFDKYAKMFGSESASIKRCKMLKAMGN